MPIRVLKAAVNGMQEQKLDCRVGDPPSLDNPPLGLRGQTGFNLEVPRGGRYSSNTPLRRPPFGAPTNLPQVLFLGVSMVGAEP